MRSFIKFFLTLNCLGWGLGGCEGLSQMPSTKVAVKPSEGPEPSPTCFKDELFRVSVPSNQPTPYQTPSYSPGPEDPQPDSRACETLTEALTRTLPHLNHPIDLAVSRDGQIVYTMNNNCFLGEPYNFEECSPPPSGVVFKTNDYLKRQFIFEIRMNRRSRLLINNVPPLSCTQLLEIESDSQDNLYVLVRNESNHLNRRSKLYRVSPLAQKVSNIVLPSESKPTATSGFESVSPGCSPTEIDWQGPKSLYLDTYDDGLYYLLVAAGEQSNDLKVRKINGGNTSYLLFDGLVSISYSFSRFSIFKGTLYLFDGMSHAFNVKYPLPYPIKEIDDKAQVNWAIDTQGLGQIKFASSGYEYGYSRRFQKIDSKGNIYTNDTLNHLIWKIPAGQFKTVVFAGNGKPGFKDGKGTTAQFNIPSGLSFDAQDNLYVADTGNHAIRKITPEGTVTTFYAEKN